MAINQHQDDKPYDSPEFDVPDYIEHTDGIDYVTSVYRDDDGRWQYVTDKGKEIDEPEIWASGEAFKAEYLKNYAPKTVKPIKYHVITTERHFEHDELMVTDCYSDVELRQALADARRLLGETSTRAHTIATVNRILSCGNSGVRKWLYYRHYKAKNVPYQYSITVQTNYEVINHA